MVNRLFKQSILFKQRIDSAQEFSRGSNNSLFIGITLPSFFKAIFSKLRTTSLLFDHRLQLKKTNKVSFINYLFNSNRNQWFLYKFFKTKFFSSLSRTKLIENIKDLRGREGEFFLQFRRCPRDKFFYLCLRFSNLSSNASFISYKRPQIKFLILFFWHRARVISYFLFKEPGYYFTIFIPSKLKEIRHSIRVSPPPIIPSMKTTDFSHNKDTLLSKIFKGFAPGLNLSQKMYKDNSLPYTINLYESRRARNKFLYEHVSSGEMLFYPSGFYFIDNHYGFKYKFNQGYHKF